MYGLLQLFVTKKHGTRSDSRRRCVCRRIEKRNGFPHNKIHGNWEGGLNICKMKKEAIQNILKKENVVNVL